VKFFRASNRNSPQRGAIPVKVAEEFRIERADIGALPSRDFGLSVLCASRPLIESVLRHRVMAIGNVSLRSQCRVVEILADTSVVRGRAIRHGSDTVGDARERSCGRCVRQRCPDIVAAGRTRPGNGQRSPRSLSRSAIQRRWCALPRMTCPNGRSC